MFFARHSKLSFTIRVMKRKQIILEKVEEITKEDRHAVVLFISPDIRDDQDLRIAKLAENENKNISEKIKPRITGKRNCAFNVMHLPVLIFLETNFMYKSYSA